MNFEYRFYEWNTSIFADIKPSPYINGNYELLNTALDCDIRECDDYIKYISDIISGKSRADNIGGDITSIECDKEKTVITWQAGDEGVCELPTWLFKEIVEVWIKAAKEYRRKKRE